jgi:hypothetical protein
MKKKYNVFVLSFVGGACIAAVAFLGHLVSDRNAFVSMPQVTTVHISDDVNLDVAGSYSVDIPAPAIEPTQTKPEPKSVRHRVHHRTTKVQQPTIEERPWNCSGSRSLEQGSGTVKNCEF